MKKPKVCSALIGPEGERCAVESPCPEHEKAQTMAARIVELEGHRNMWRRRAQMLEELVPKHCPHACTPPCPFDQAMGTFRGYAASDCARKEGDR